MPRDESKELMKREPSVVSPMEEMERLFETFMGRPLFPSLFRRSQMMQEVSPSIDVFEENDQVVVRAEIPGMQKEQIEINLSEDMLTLSGEKKEQSKVEKKGYYRMESSYGSFTRTVPLPCEVQTEKAQATYKDGVLEIRVPKTQAAKEKMKKITIQ